MRKPEVLMFQEVWRKAYAADDGLELTFRTRQGAVRGRLQLYNAVQAQKSGEDMSDLTLVKAAEELEIVWAGETTIRLQKRADNDVMQTIQAALGKTVSEFVDPELESAAERMLKSLEAMPDAEPPTDQPQIGHQDNPFYGKRD